MYHSDFMVQKLVAAHIADLHAEAARERLARQVAPDAYKNVDRILVVLFVVAVALGILLYAV